MYTTPLILKQVFNGQNCLELRGSVIMHLLEVMAIMGITAQIKTDNGPAYVSKKWNSFSAYYNIKHITGIPNNPTCQAVIEKSNQTIKDMLNKHKGIKIPSK